MMQLDLLARAYQHILKVARTNAHLVASEANQSSHLAETLQYRPKVIG
jgi:predicted ATPase with chaperone activity